MDEQTVYSILAEEHNTARSAATRVALARVTYRIASGDRPFGAKALIEVEEMLKNRYEQDKLVRIAAINASLSKGEES